MTRFGASIRFYEFLNAGFYRNRRRAIDKDMSALINLLFAGAGVGSLIGYGLYYLLEVA